MTHKERIAWYLALQQLGKLPRNRVAPAVAIRKRQAKLSAKENSETSSMISQKPTPFARRFVISRPLASVLSNQDKVQIPGSKSDTVASASLSPQLSIRAFRKPLATVQPVARHDQRPLVMHTYGDTTRHYQVLTEQLAVSRGLSPAMTVESAALTGKSFAPNHTSLPSPQDVNGDSLEVAQYAINYQTELTTADQRMETGQSNFERPFRDKLATAIPIKGRDSVVDQDQTPSGSSSSASTLHLDGSALGRWAVQHLERVLSKPPAGMTGVDPRATVPRSRVAPF